MNLKHFQKPAAALASCFLALAAFAGSAGSNSEIRPGPGVSRVGKLSDYLPSLAGTPGDTFVYYLEGRESGGSVFVAGGTHPNEIAGVVAATVLIEHARVQKGRLIVIAHANNSAASYPDPFRKVPPFISIKTHGGERHIRYGARFTKPGDQGAKDPEKFRNPNSKQDLDGREARNLDRNYPGRTDGNLTERMAWAIIEVLKKESVDAAFDFHEAKAGSRLALSLEVNPKSIDIAATAILDLDAGGIKMKLDSSPEEFRGLSHKEWGDATKAHAFLFETPNPAMGNNNPNVDFVNDPQYSLAKRVGLHLSSFLAVLNSYNQSATPALTIKMQDVPELNDLVKSGLGAFLK